MEQPTSAEQEAAHIIAESINNAMVRAVHAFAVWYGTEYEQLTPDAARILARFFCQRQGWIRPAEPTQERDI